MKLFLFFCFISFVYSQSPCSYSDGNNSWDLSPLTYNSGDTSPSGYSYSTADSTYFVNFCEQVSILIENNACNVGAPSGVCQDSASGYNSAGSVSDISFSPITNTTNGGIAVTYTNGEFCPAVGAYRTSTIYVTCDSEAGIGELYNAYETAEKCEYILYFRSAYGCPIVPNICNAFEIQTPLEGGTVSTFGNNKFAHPYTSENCDTGASGSAWYTINPRSHSTVTLSTCNSITTFDSVLGVYTGSCGNLTCAYYNDNYCGTQSQVTFTAGYEQLYYISVSGNTETDNGNFQLDISVSTPIINYDLSCYLAHTTNAPYDPIMYIQGQLSNHSTINIPSCGMEYGAYVDWYRITNLNSQSISFSLCNTPTNFDATLSVFTGSACNNLQCQQYNNSCFNGKHFTGSIGGIYSEQNSDIFIAISSNYQIEGTYELSIFQPNSE